MPSQFMQRLRQSIMPLHDEAEKSGPLSAIPEKLVTLQEYRRILERLYGFVFVAENIIQSQVQHSGLDYKARIRVDHLVKDLIFLGNTRESLIKIPVCQGMPVIRNTPQGLGLLYLFEGSRLGGLVLSKALKEHFGFRGYQGYAYFASNGMEVATMWAYFKDFMENYVQTQGGGDDIIIAAKKGFVSLNMWLAG